MILKIMGHFDASVNLMSDHSEVMEVINLGLKASSTAMENTTYDIAYKWLTMTIKLMEKISEKPWEDHHNLFLQIYEKIVMAAWRSSHTTTALELIACVLSQPDLSIQSTFYFLRFKCLILQQLSEYNEALTTGLDALQLLGHPIDIDYEMDFVKSEITKLLSLITEKGGPEQLIQMLECSLTKLQMTSIILFDLVPVSYCLSKSSLYCMLSIYIVNLTIKYGPLPTFVEALSLFGFVISGFFGFLEEGGNLCVVGEKICRSKKSLPLQSFCRGLLHAALGGQWKQPHRIIAKWLEDTISPSIHCGDATYAIFSCMFHVDYAILSCLPLYPMKTFLQDKILLAQRHQQIDVERGLQAMLSWIKYLVDGPETIPTEPENLHLEPKLAGSSYHLYGMISLYYVNHLQTAYHYSLIIQQQYFNEIVGMGRYYIANFYCFIVNCTSVYHGIITIDKIKEFNIQALKSLTKWALISPSNYQSKKVICKIFWRLLEMREKSSTLKRKKCDSFYIRSLRKLEEIVAVCETESLFPLGTVALRLSTKLSKELGLSRSGYSHSVEAKSFLMRWGVMTIREHKHSHSFINTSIDMSENMIPSLDYSALVHASQILTTKQTKVSLFSEFFAIILTSSGATRIVLVLSEGDEAATIPIVAAYKYSSGEVVFTSEPLDSLLPAPLVRMVFFSVKIVCIPDCSVSQYKNDTYIIKNGVKSIFCFPILHKGQTKGVVYLEHDKIFNAFEPSRISLLRIVASQMILSINNVEAFETLKQKNLEMHQLDILKDEFLARVSHELRTPLNGILGIASHTLEATRTITEYQDDYRTIMLCGEQLLLLINDLLDFCQLRGNTLFLNLEVRVDLIFVRILVLIF
jgi:hypothetical protein